MLMYDRRKEHINKSREKQNTTSHKTNCLFNIVATLEEQG